MEAVTCDGQQQSISHYRRWSNRLNHNQWESFPHSNTVDLCFLLVVSSEKLWRSNLQELASTRSSQGPEMRFAKTLAVATGLSLGLYTDATFSTRCDSNEDCAVGTICVDVGFPRGNPLNGAVCVQGCAKSDDCDNNCCATHVTPPSCANPDFYQGFTGACYSEDGCDCRG
ncbi:unnamed protein product, partial [Scytosiphon promiscuus]